MFLETFIKRPILSSVCSIIILFCGLICIPLLPIEQYPQLAPPQILISANYIGANAQTVESTVTTPLEQAINGVELSKVFNCSVNELPLSLVLSWYEQKAVCILLTLLYLGIENIKLGPSLPAFVSPNILNVLVEKFKIAPITTPEQDLKEILG